MKRNLRVLGALSKVTEFNGIRSTNLQMLHLTLTEISFLNLGYNLTVNVKHPKMNLKTYKESVFEDFKYHIGELKKGDEEFNAGFMNVEQVDQYIEIKTARNVSIKMEGETFSNMSFIDSIQQIITKSVNLIEHGVEKIGFKDEDTDFIVYNSFNNVHLQIRTLSQFTDFINSNTIEIIESFAVISRRIYVAISMWTFIFLSISIVCYQKSKEKLIELFYGFNDSDIKINRKQIERILDDIQLEKDEMNSFEILNTVLNDDKVEVEDKVKINTKQKEESENFLRLRTKKKKGRLNMFWNYHTLLVFFSISVTCFLSVLEIYRNSGLVVENLKIVANMKTSTTGIAQLMAYCNNMVNLVRYPKNGGSFGRVATYSNSSTDREEEQSSVKLFFF